MQGPGLLDKLFIFGGVDMVHHSAHKTHTLQFIAHSMKIRE